MKKTITALMCAVLVLSSCGNMSNLAKGTAIGGEAGLAVGAIAGAIASKVTHSENAGKNAAIGAAIGTAVGAGVGALIGNKMDKKAEEMAALEGAQVEIIKDANDLAAIKVTFDSGILFATDKADLNKASKDALTKFAASMTDMKDTDVAIYGHTDNTGSAAVNERLSLQRAQSVADFLKGKGMENKMTVEGKSFNEPVADNSTAEGRKQNRRVEVFISANQAMIQAAEDGTLK
ncbi:MAG: OmpA family protein [Bacteroidales bacterium]|nr:OmpA family protein [Bacteroidales bacterium]